MNNMTSGEILLKVRKETGMNRREFAEYFGIPLRTVEDWEADRRKISDYLLHLMLYKLKAERLLKADDE